MCTVKEYFSIVKNEINKGFQNDITLLRDHQTQHTIQSNIIKLHLSS